MSHLVTNAVARNWGRKTQMIQFLCLNMYSPFLSYEREKIPHDFYYQIIFPTFFRLCNLNKILSLLHNTTL